MRVKNIVVVIILIIFATVTVVNGCKATLMEQRWREEVIRNSSLEKVNSEQYRKIVADTLTKKQLRRELERLNFEISNVEPKILIKEIEVIYRDTVSVPELIDSTLVDYYPNKDDWILKYTVNFNTKLSEFIWKPVKLDVLLSERSLGMWQADVKVPSFMEVGRIDIVALPLKRAEVPRLHSLQFYGGATYNFKKERYSPYVGVGILKNGILTLNTETVGLLWRIK